MPGTDAVPLPDGSRLLRGEGCAAVAGCFDRAFGDAHQWLDRTAVVPGVPAVFASLHDGPRRLGLRLRRTEIDEINRYPHPCG